MFKLRFHPRKRADKAEYVELDSSRANCGGREWPQAFAPGVLKTLNQLGGKHGNRPRLILSRTVLWHDESRAL